LRNTPSLRYAHAPVAFTQHFLESQVTLGVDDEGPTGGRTWDGRVDTAHDQALMPLMDPNEMANADGAAVVKRLKTTPYADEFRRVLSAPGENVFDDPDSTLVWVTVALETYEQSAPEFHPFDSKFDAWLADKATLSPAERRGMALFNDMKKGNCASCHPSTRKAAANRPPIFTDFGFVALGVPRNADLPANRDPGFFDLGLCGPLRSDLAAHPEYCGMFRTPSLRNVALRGVFFHNGVYTKLEDAVRFYALRDVDPQRVYGHGRYDDLPAKYQGNLNVEAPFGGQRGGRPRLTEAEIADVVAFLGTLTDGYVAPGGAKVAAAAKPD
jgi:cytochrome c peroxidase